MEAGAYLLSVQTFPLFKTHFVKNWLAKNSARSFLYGASIVSRYYQAIRASDVKCQMSIAGCHKVVLNRIAILLCKVWVGTQIARKSLKFAVFPDEVRAIFPLPFFHSLSLSILHQLPLIQKSSIKSLMNLAISKGEPEMTFKINHRYVLFCILSKLWFAKLLNHFFSGLSNPLHPAKSSTQVVIGFYRNKTREIGQVRGKVFFRKLTPG